MDDPTSDVANEIYEEPRGWFGVTFLTWSVLLSCLLHSSLLIPSMVQFPHQDADIDLEWLKTFDSLEGLGHGSDGRWAEVRVTPPRPEPAPIDETLVGPEPPATPPEPKPKPPQPLATPKPKPRPVPKPKVEPPPRPPRTPAEVYAQGELPGLDRAGPSQLPSMEGYGPGNAVFTALLRLDRIRGTEFEEPTRKLIAAVPDYRILLEGTGVDPVRDFSSMFMASANPIYIDETFLAVRHHKNSSTLREELDRRFDTPLAWEEQRNFATRALVPPDSPYTDPRQIMLPAGDLALVVRPEWVSQLTRALPDGSRLLEGVDAGSLNRRPTMLDGLAQIERAADDDDTVMLMSAMGARITLPGIGRLAFEGAKLRVAGLDKPRLTIDLTLSTADEASRLAASCPNLKKRILEEVPWIARNITKMLVERLTCNASENYVVIAGTYTRREAQRVLNIVVPFVPRPPILSKLPKPKNPVEPVAPPSPTTVVDAGNGAPVSPAVPDMGVSEHGEQRDGGAGEQHD